MKSTPIVGVAIVGGGPAGSALALSLCDAGIDVALIERSTYESVRAGEHLIAEAKPLLARLAVGDGISNSGFCTTCPVIRSAWGEPALADRDAILNAYGEGFLLARPAFDLWLAEQAEARGAKFLRKTSLSGLNRIDGGWKLALNREGRSLSLECRIVVDATGRSAKVGRLLGCTDIAYDRLIGIIGYGESDGHRSADAHDIIVEASRDGWWYSSRLHDGRLVTTWMTDADILAESNLSPADFFLQRLSHSTHTNERVRAQGPLREFHVRSACSRRLDRICGDRWLAVGDAAMSWDPLSSSGIYNSLDTGVRSAEAIRQYLQNVPDALNLYESRIQQAFDDYLDRRMEYYRIETRWSDSRFWSRRHQH